MKSIIYIILISFCFSLHLSAQKFSSIFTEDWANGNWKNSTRLTNTFDSKGNVIKETNESWNDTTKLWIQDLVIMNTFNPDFTINYSTTQMWNKNTKMWEDFMKMAYTYDASKHVLTLKTQMNMGLGWMDFSMTTNTYNASGLLTKSLSQNLNYMTNQLEDASQTTYTYNADGTEAQNVSQIRNIISGTWDNSTRTTNTYTAGKKISSVLNENFIANAWVNKTKSTTTYYANGAVMESVSQDWDVTAANWVNAEKDDYSYSADGSLHQSLTTEWNKVLTQWDNQTRKTYTNDASTFIKPALAGNVQLQVFPNPFTNVISVDFNSSKAFSFQLFNANGQLVKVIQKGEPHSEINLSSLKNGVYFLQVVSPESQKVLKLLKSSN